MTAFPKNQRHVRAAGPLAAALLALFSTVSSSLVAHAATKPTLVFNGAGVTLVHLRDPARSALSVLRRALGAPTAPLAASPSLRRCGVDEMASWHSFSIYLDHGVVVGLSLGPGTRPAGETSAGLRLGDTLSRARSLYGTALRSSTAQGGTWFVRVADGRLDGFLAPSGPAPGPRSRILTIDVGVVGCPAMSP